MKDIVKMTKAIGLLDRIRGSMAGAVIGDCLGSPVECQYWHGIPVQMVQKLFEDYRKPDQKVLHYTDDTAMARQVADSIIAMQKVDSKDLAERFVVEYFKERGRGYGQSVVEVFKKLKKSECQDPFKPASEQFNGSGSYGNGAAMRIHPIGLFSYKTSFSNITENVEKCAKVTHTHLDGVNGAILQAACVSWALEGKSSTDIRIKAQELCTNFKNASNDDTDDEPETYFDQMQQINDFLDDNELLINAIKGVDDDLVTMVNTLGKSIYYNS